MNTDILKKPYWPYIMPFLAFLVLTYAGAWLFVEFTLTETSLEQLRHEGEDSLFPEDVLERLKGLQGQTFTAKNRFLQAVEQQIGAERAEMYGPAIVTHAKMSHGTYIFYPLKTLLVAALLLYYRKSYPEISLRVSWLGILVGGAVFVIWVAPERWLPQIAQFGSSEFNPYFYGTGWLAYVLIAFRLIGAALVVPVFEELFWRSFAIRWVIDEDFQRVAIGAFTWFSCLVIVLGFGFEHHRWFVGILAGICYNGLLYYTKDIGACIQAHAVTNLLLGMYVVLTQQWSFW